MSIKYSEIYTATPVVSAGANDLMVIAIVDGGAPTGFTTKGIKVSDFLSGISGDVATDVIWDANLDLAVGTGSDTAVRLAGGTALQVLRVNGAGNALEWAAPSSGNTLYSADDTIGSGRIATITDTMTFTGGKIINIGSGDTNSTKNFTIQSLSNTNSISYYNGGNLISETINGTFNWGVISGTVNQGGIEISNTGAAGITWGRIKGYAGFPASPDEMTFTLGSNTSREVVFDLYKANVKKATIQATNNGAKFHNGNLGVGVDPTSLLHTKGGDVKFEGATDANLFFLDESTNQLAIGSTPYANVKASITNTEGVSHSFLVLNQATISEFGVMETGVVYMNFQLSVGAGNAPSSSSNILSAGDIETTNHSHWYYNGDPTTNDSWRFGANGATDFLHQRRIAGVWVTKQTIAG